MLEEPKRLLTSALIPFIPRQIMLGTYNAAAAAAAAAQKEDMKTRKEETAATEEKRDKKKKKKKKRSSETPEADSAPTEALVLDRPNGGTLPGQGKRKGILLSWIAAYLESNGFSKTLAVFRSEAQSEINDGEASFLNSEDLFYNFLESRSYEETTIDLQKEQDSEKVGIHGNDHCNGKVILDATEHLHSKKRKSINRIDDGTKAEIHKPGLVKCSDEHINTNERISNKIVEVKSEEKEVNRFSSEGCSAPNSGISGDKNLKELKISADKTDLKELVSADDSRVESKDKKKKKKRKLVSDSLGEHAEKCHLEGSHGKENTDQENQMPKPHENDKEKRKKKHKECDGTLKSQEMGEEKIEELESLTNNSPSAESNLKHKNEKKKKTKRTSDSLSKNVEQLELEASQELINKKPKGLKSLDCETNIDFKILNSETNDASIKNTVDNTDSEMKDKKKKKGKPLSGSLHAVSSDQLEGGSSHDGKEGHGMGHKTKDVMGRSDSGKEKKVLVSEDIDSEKVSKKKKRLASEEKASQAENEILTKESDGAKLEGAEGNNGTGTHQKPDKYLQDNEYLATGKKRKTKKSNEKSTETVKTSPNEQHNILSEDKENPSGCDSQKEEGHQLANGNLEKKERADTSSKATEKENRSAEPKTVKAFRRVKLDEVTDERFRDNSYWAKGGAEEGYGAKAQEILGQVRGRDFRHEKTKKKRGTYRGGQIDLQSHSIKFDYSDGE